MPKKTEKTKKKILNKVLTIVGKNGVKALSARKLADAMKMTPANLYHHFKNMDEIIGEAIMYHLASYRKDIFHEQHDDLYEYLVATEQGILQYIDKNSVQIKGYKVLCISYAHRPDIKKRISNLLLSRRETGTEKIKEIIGERVEKETVDRFMMGLTLLMEGSHQYASGFGFKEEYFEAFKYALRVLVNDLLGEEK